MDAAGAEKLRLRIEQQQHWRQAQAVGDGRQPATDPDGATLERLGDGIRVYGTRVTRGGLLTVCKRLIDGVWELGTLATPWDGSADTAPEREIARVA